MTHKIGLIFDVDGVIADTEPLNAKVTIKVLGDLFGLQGVRPEDFAAGFGRGAEAYVKAGAKVHGLELAGEQVAAAAVLRERYLIEALRRDPLPAFPGVLELMAEALQQPEFRLAIATSATLEISRAILESARVPYQKMVYVTGSEVKEKKPSPEIFLVAARRMGIEPFHCVVFEDAPSGVQAAKAAGARCIAVTNTAPAEELRQADLVCDSLAEITLDMSRLLADES